jgi:hypothetical protein
MKTSTVHGDSGPILNVEARPQLPDNNREAEQLAATGGTLATDLVWFFAGVSAICITVANNVSTLNWL